MRYVIFYALILLQLLWGESKPINEYTFSLTQNQLATLKLDWESNKSFVMIEDMQIPLNTFSKYFIRTWQKYGDHYIVFDDFNFDGYTDISLASNLEQKNKCVTSDYYFYVPQKKIFSLYLEDVCGIFVSQKEHILHAHIKQGIWYEHKYYQIDYQGEPYLFLTSKNTIVNDDTAEEQYISSAEVKVKKAYLYDIWEGERLKVYLTEGEKVKVVGIESFKGRWWVKVLYHRQYKVHKYWVKMQDLFFQKLFDKKVMIKGQ